MHTGTAATWIVAVALTMGTVLAAQTAQPPSPSSSNARPMAAIENSCLTALGVFALSANVNGCANAAFGAFALAFNTSGGGNVGADVTGTASDAHTIRIGLPFNGGAGQNRTFIAGIHGAPLTGPAVQVFVDANGQLEP